MILINHHIHTTGSDGKLSPEKLVKLAIEKKLGFICFTDHYKRQNNDEYAKKFFSKKYLKQIKDVKEKYKDQIEISFGVEMDWFENAESWIKKEISKYDFDYVLGSVHIIKLKNNKYFGINFEEEELKSFIKKFGVRRIVKEYYKQVRLMSESRIFDSVGHLDVIKTFDIINKQFNQKENWYKEEIIKTLKTIKKNNLCIDINTSGLIYPCNEIFPSFWIIKEANKLNIPITIGSDCHKAEGIDYHLKDAIDLAKKAGYKKIIKFKNRKRINIKI